MSGSAAIRGTFRIPLSRGHFALVDAEDYAFVAQWKWHYMPSRYTGYAKRSVKTPDGPKSIRMHRVLTGAKEGQTVDHINGNGLDNRRGNLRLVSNAENCQNRVTVRKDNTSGYTGVFERSGNAYRVYLSRFGKRIWIGTYSSKTAAIKARQEAEEEYARA
jgi:hypothetical protein